MLIRGLARSVATFFGPGLSPWAPGTMGSIAGIAVAYACDPYLGTAGWLVLIAVASVATVWSSNVVARTGWKDDDGRIVLDEVVGVWIAILPLDRSDGWLWLVALAAFRFFDIRKPGPIRWLERNVAGGAGVLLDDVAAGVCAALCSWAAASV